MHAKTRVSTGKSIRLKSRFPPWAIRCGETISCLRARAYEEAERGKRAAKLLPVALEYDVPEEAELPEIKTVGDLLRFLSEYGSRRRRLSADESRAKLAEMLSQTGGTAGK